MSVVPRFYNNIGKLDSFKWEVRVPLPPGISWTGVMPTNIPASLNPTMFMDGDTLVLRRTGGTTNGATPEAWFHFPLHLDCSLYTGGSLSLSYMSRFTVNDGCVVLNTTCGNFSNIAVHCPNPCKGPVPIALDNHRTTAGWTDNTQNTRADLSQAVAMVIKFIIT